MAKSAGPSIGLFDADGAAIVMPAYAGIQEHMALASGDASWIPGLALLARNDGLGVFVIPAYAGIQEHK